MAVPDIHARLAELGPWYHSVTVDGWTAPGKVDPTARIDLALDALPDDLTGRTVLDVGGNCGSVALALARRGASATVVEPMKVYRRQGRLLAEHYGLDVTFRRGDVYDVRGLGTFDHVVFYGLIYHLRHPLLALDIIRAATGRSLVMSSRINRSRNAVWSLGNVAGSTPALNQEHAHNWWLPSASGMEQTLHVYGFTDVRTLQIDTDRSEGFWSAVPDAGIGRVGYLDDGPAARPAAKEPVRRRGSGSRLFRR